MFSPRNSRYVFSTSKDPLLKNFVIPCGSFYEDLKVGGPDKFDFLICLEELSSRGVCVMKIIPLQTVPNPGYVDVQFANEDNRGLWQRYISEHGIVKPDVLLERFKQLIDEAIANRQRSIHYKLGKRLSPI